MPAKLKDPEGSFWARTTPVGDCWVWIGARNRDGYGVVGFKIGHHRESLAHRVAYYLHNGTVPLGGNRRGTLIVRHSCDNRACCNPAHLVLGTPTDNARDCVSRGRLSNRQGEHHPRATLSDDDVRSIRAAPYRRGDDKRTAERLGCAPRVVKKARLGLTWRHL